MSREKCTVVDLTRGDSGTDVCVSFAAVLLAGTISEFHFVRFSNREDRSRCPGRTVVGPFAVN